MAGKSYKGNLGSNMMLRKVMGSDYIDGNHWNGAAESDIDLRITKHACRYCGLPMFPFKDDGNTLIWACNNDLCFNGVNSKLRADYTFDEFTTIGDQDHIFGADSWMPTTLI